MGVMRRNLLLILALFTAVCINVNAETTPAQLTDPEYMINGGYSEAAAEEVFIIKRRTAGESCEPLYEKNHSTNKFVRFFKNCYTYWDPSIDNEERYHHDIQMSPHYTDL